jgi:hypothetical protein
MTGHAEELALEKLAVIEHERRADELWRQRNYAESLYERTQARYARANVAEMESREQRS